MRPLIGPTDVLDTLVAEVSATTFRELVDQLALVEPELG